MPVLQRHKHPSTTSCRNVRGTSGLLRQPRAAARRARTQFPKLPNQAAQTFGRSIKKQWNNKTGGNIMEIVKYQFDGNNIDFEINNKTIMPNAAEMAKCFPGKRVFNFLKLETTKEYIRVLENKYGNKVYSQNSKNSTDSKENITIKDCNRSLLSTENFTNEDEDNMELEFEISENILKVIRGRNGGTWMHELLALKFAAWLNAEFELWVYETIHSLVVGAYIKLVESYKQTMCNKYEIKQVMQKLRTNEDYQRLQDLKTKNRQLNKSIRKFSTSEKELSI
jgi:hypothetical protein